MEEEAVHHIDSTVQQQQQQEEEKDPFDIPHRFEVEQQALLAGTHISWEWETIGGIKCQLCPDIRGDFFARSDSHGRHRKTPPPACLSVALEEAAEKRRETQKAREEFEVRLVTGEDIGMPFSQIIKRMYPKSSKKHIGGQ